MNKRLLMMLVCTAMVAPWAFAAEAEKGAEAKAAESKALPPKGPAIKLYEATMIVAADGAADVRGRIQLTGVAPGPLEVPFAPWGDIADFTLAGADAKGPPNTKAANPRLTVVLPAGTGETAELQFAFNVPAPKPAVAKDAKAGEAAAVESRYRYVSHRFMNGTNLPVDRYRVEVWLPEGEVVHTVPDAQPKAGPKDVKRRVVLVGKDGRQGGVLEMNNLRLGGATSMRLESEPAHKSWTLLWIGLILSALYLVFFRDLVRPREDGHGPREHHTHKDHE